MSETSMFLCLIYFQFSYNTVLCMQINGGSQGFLHFWDLNNVPLRGEAYLEIFENWIFIFS